MTTSLSNKVKAIVGAMFVAAMLVVPMASGLVQKASAQTVPSWDASSTDAIITPTADSFKENAIYVLSTIWPYALGFLAVILIGTFFLSMLHRRRVGSHGSR